MMTRLEMMGYPSIDIPDLADIVGGFVQGRNVREGYQRGWGLEFGPVKAAVDAHPLFQLAMARAAGRSVMDGQRLRNLFLILTCYMDKLDDHNVIEFGSYRGGSLLFVGTILEALYPAARVYGYDTFAGMPTTDRAMDLHSGGDFRDTSTEEILSAAASHGLHNIELRVGLVEDTFPAQAPPGVTYGLAHIDLDIYHPIVHCQHAILPFMTRGGYVVYDDATVSSCIGATQAVEEYIHRTGARSEQIFPHFVFRAGV